MQLSRFLPLLFALSLASSTLAQSIPDGARLFVGLDSTVSSRTAHVGDVVAASLARDLVIDGKVVARRGAPVRAKVTYARSSGRFSDPGYVTVRLDSIELDGKRYLLHSSAIRDEGKGHTESNLVKVGGGTGLGALIGGLAGGGSGALIGSLAGAGGGTALAAATGKHAAELPAETTYDVQLTEAAEPAS